MRTEIDTSTLPNVQRMHSSVLGTANITVSLLFGAASLVCLALRIVIPWWAAGAVAGIGLLLAELWIDRQETGEWWTLEHALEPVVRFEELELNAARRVVSGALEARDALPRSAPTHARRTRMSEAEESVPLWARAA
jgi:hypothetical protein